MKTIFCIVLSVTSLFALSSCGYRFGYASRGLPGGYDLVAIPVFANETQFVGIAPYFTNAIREEFQRSKVARVVSKAAAPVVLNGQISGLSMTRGGLVEGAGATTSGVAQLPINTALATEYRIIVTSDLQLVRSSDKKVLWKGTFRNEVIYSAPRIGTPVLNSANANYNDSMFQQKVAELSLIMMEEAHDRVTENF